MELDLLAPFPAGVTVDYSTKCNLRCTYCATGSSTYVETDMSERVIDDIASFCRQLEVRDVWLSASGETTMTPGWEESLGVFLDDRGFFRPHINSNFARPFTKKDLDALNRFGDVQISLDSSEPELTKKLRTADLRTIVFNIVRLRQTMIANNRSTVLRINCVVSRENITHIEGLASLALLLGISHVMLSELSDSNDNPRMPDLLDKMTEEEAVAFARSVFRANELLRGSPTTIDVQGALLAKLMPALKALGEGVTPTNVMANFRAGTRQSVVGPCLEPWNTVIVTATGNVNGCCGSSEPSGNVNEAPLLDIYNGEKARAFRQRLLDGGPDLPCKVCPVATSATPEQFRATVEEEQRKYADRGLYYPPPVTA